MRTPLTKEGYDRLSAELEHLKTTERPAIIEAIAEARAHGDLSENAEYHSAKEKQGYIEARIKLLESVVSSADIIDPTTIGANGRCIFGAFVDLQNADGKTITYRIVGEHEADVNNGMLSSTSPVGQALLGKYADDEVIVNTPSGELEYTVLAVRYEAVNS